MSSPNSCFTSAAGRPKTSPLPFNVIVYGLPRLALLLLRESRMTVAMVRAVAIGEKLRPAFELRRCPLRVVIAYPTIVTIFKHVITAVRPIIKTLPGGQNRLRSFNFHLDARFHKATYLPQLAN